MSDCCTPNGYRQIFSEKNAAGEAKRTGARASMEPSSESSIHQRAWSRGQDASRGGGGIGAIEIEPLKAGMARAIDVELTPTNEAAARELLVEAGPLVHV